MAAPPATLAFVSWPAAPLTRSLVIRTLGALTAPPPVVAELPPAYKLLLQWSTYDAIDHDCARADPTRVLASSYTIRKALIRKHFLACCIHAHLTKRPAAALRAAAPRTWALEIAFADELDGMWADELWELGGELERGEQWWILKPGMADRGMGIRLFASKEALQRIFEAFDGDDGEEDGNDDDGDATAVVTSQLRYFVIQVS